MTEFITKALNSDKPNVIKTAIKKIENDIALSSKDDEVSQIHLSILKKLQERLSIYSN